MQNTVRKEFGKIKWSQATTYLIQDQKLGILVGKYANCWFFGRELLRPEVVLRH
jgi:hypothetical protein